MIKKIRAMDQKVDEKHAARQRLLKRGARAKGICQDEPEARETFPKFAYKQKVIEEMIVVAGNIHENCQTSSRHIVGGTFADVDGTTGSD